MLIHVEQVAQALLSAERLRIISIYICGLQNTLRVDLSGAHVFAVHALALICALNAAIVALAVLFLAVGLFAVTPLAVALLVYTKSNRESVQLPAH